MNLILFLYLIGVILSIALCMIIVHGEFDNDEEDDYDILEIFAIIFISIFSWLGVISIFFTKSILNIIEDK